MKRTVFLVSLFVAPFVALAINAEFGALMFMICILALLGWLIRLIVEKIKSGRKPAAQHPAQPVKNTARKPSGVDPLENKRQSISGMAQYFYTDVGVYVPDMSVFRSGSEIVPPNAVELCQDPYNPYDNKAVAVCQRGETIGYLYRGKIQAMANDWIDRCQGIECYISFVDASRYDADKNGLKIDIAFY